MSSISTIRSSGNRFSVFLLVMVFLVAKSELWQTYLDAYDVTRTSQIIGEAWRCVDKCPAGCAGGSKRFGTEL